MNICMLVYGYPPLPVGGAERQCRLQAEELVRKGHGCRVVTARSRGGLTRRQEENGVGVYRVTVAQPFLDRLLRMRPQKTRKPAEAEAHSPVPASGKQNRPVSRAERWVSKTNALLFMWNAGWLIWRKRKEIDVLHTHVASWNAGFAAWLGVRLGIPVICKAANLPAFDEFQQQVPFAAALEKWRLRGSYLALTAEMKTDLEKQGVASGRIRVLPNGVPEASRSAKPEESKQVLFVGNFSQGAAHKAYDIILQAWAEVAKEFPDWRLCMAGGGDTAPWMKMADALGCGESVRFPGRVEDLSGTYAETALLVLLSRIEGISNALLEAQSAGIPAVVSDIPGNRAVVTDGENGFVVACGESAPAAAALRTLMQDPSLRKAMGDKAKKRIGDQFSIASVVDRLTGIYGELKAGETAA